MHPASFNLMQRFAVNVPLDAKVLDIGALDVNGSLRELFWQGYVGCDIVAGPNVDLVLEDPCVLPLPDESVDVVVSANAFEHVAMPWLLVLELDRVLKHDGVVAITAPWVFQYHHPPDYWRMSPDALQVLFGAWLSARGRCPYIEHAAFTQASCGSEDTYYEARKP